MTKSYIMPFRTNCYAELDSASRVTCEIPAQGRNDQLISKSSIAWVKQKLIIALCAITIISLLFVRDTKADTMSTIETLMTSMSCETTEIGNMLQGKWGHTCVTQSFSTLASALILNPTAAFYLAGIMTMNLNNDTLYPGNCARNKRADPRDPKLMFSFCNDILLKVALAELIPKVIYSVAASVVEGDNVWDAVESALVLDPNIYTLGPAGTDSAGTYATEFPSSIRGHNGFRPGFIGAAMAGTMPLFVTVTQEDDQICASTVGVTGYLAMGCKYIAEPSSTSRYDNFMSGNGTATPFTQCAGMGSCYTDANTHSQTLLPISGPLIGCIKAMLNQFLFSPTVCASNGSTIQQPSTFYQFQLNMQKTVTALLTLYIILFGFRLVLAAGELKQADIFMFFIKFILVVYFSVGINMQSGRGSAQQGFDGMTQWVFPIVLNGANDIAGWIMNASPSGLCQFTNNAPPPSSSTVNIVSSTGAVLGTTSTQLTISSSAPAQNSIYPSGYSWLALWDALDCRVTHYLGLDTMGDALSLTQQNNASLSDSFNFSVPPYFFLLVPAVLTGNFALAMLAISYPVLVISVGAYMVNAFVVCLIAVVILGVLAPIFVPMALFNFTKGYFDSWAKAMLSFVLQPMVVATFMITLFTVFDAGFYGTCKYAQFTIPDPSGNGSTKTMFAINADTTQYSAADWKSCQNSLGYMINSPFAAASSASSAVTSIKNTVSYGQTYTQFSAKFPLLGAITSDVGLFFTSPGLALQAIKSFIFSILTACFCLYVMYQLSSQISEFAVDMVEGVAIGGATIGPRTIMSKVQSAAQKFEDKMNERKVKPRDKGEGDKDGKGKDRAEDGASGASRGSGTQGAGSANPASAKGSAVDAASGGGTSSSPAKSGAADTAGGGVGNIKKT